MAVLKFTAISKHEGKDDTAIYINKEKIAAVHEQGDETLIIIEGGNGIRVRETVETVVAMLRSAHI